MDGGHDSRGRFPGFTLAQLKERMGRPMAEDIKELMAAEIARREAPGYRPFKVPQVGR